MKFYNESDFVYMDCHIRMSKEKLSSVLYAMIMCFAKITNSYGVGIYEYSRQQNSFNGVDLKIFIHPDEISNFQRMSGAMLTKPISITIN